MPAPTLLGSLSVASHEEEEGKELSTGLLSLRMYDMNWL